MSLADQIVGVKSEFVSCSGLADFKGCKIHYLAAGVPSAHPVVMVHGNPTWSFYYRNLVRDLGQYYYAVAPDFLGCGLSSRTSRISFSERAEELKFFIDSLGVDKVSLVLHDWGGPIGALYAVNNLDKIASITFQNTTLGELSSLPWIIRVANCGSAPSAFLQYTSEFVDYAVRYGVNGRLPAGVKDFYFAPYRTSEQRSAIRDFVLEIPTGPHHPSYKTFQELQEKIHLLHNVPTQVLWGAQDPCFHMGIYRTVVEKIRPDETHVYDVASHLLNEDCPGEVAAAIFNFLKCRFMNMVTPAYDAKQFKTIYDRVVSQDSKKPALIIEGKNSYESISYGDLRATINQYQRGLVDLGLRSRDKVLFLIQPDDKLFALSLAVIGLGAIPVFVDPGMSLSNLKICFQRLRANAIIYGGKALLLRVLFSDIFKGLKFTINTSNFNLGFFGTNVKFFSKFSKSVLPEQGHRVSPDDTCIIAHTSGATGVPKGVEITYRALDTTINIFHEDLIKDKNNINLTLLPIFALFDLANGNTSILPKFDSSKPLQSLNPQSIQKVMKDLEVRSAFGSGMLWLKLASYMSENRLSLPKLKNLFLIGAPVDDSTLKKLSEVFPETTISTPYGATEFLPAANINASQIDNKRERSLSGELGVPVGTVTRPTTLIKIFRLSTRSECENREIGEIWVSGPQVSARYHNNPEATESAKYRDSSGNLWHYSGDLGYLVGNDIYYCGRANHSIIAKGRTYYSKCVENVCNTHPLVYRSALVVISPKLRRGYDTSMHELEEIGVVVELNKDIELSEKVALSVTDELQKLMRSDYGSRGISNVFFHRSLPVDTRHNAKIFRCKLGVEAFKLQQKGRKF